MHRMVRIFCCRYLRVQCLIQISEQIGDIFESDGDSDQFIRDSVSQSVLRVITSVRH